MSTREMAYSILDGMSEKELLAFVYEHLGFSGIPNQETLDAFEELHYMEEHPEEYKSYDDVDEMFQELLNE